MKKVCQKCKKEYPATNEFFHKDKYATDKLYCYCKDCQRKYYQDNKERIAEQGKEYRGNHKEEKAEQSKTYSQTIKGIYQKTKQNATAKNLEICSQQDFIIWYKKQKQQCVYCDITKELLKPLKWGHHKKRNRLTIDRKDNDIGYLIDNICLACEVCNRSKNEDISFEEMKIIGRANNKVWKIRLQKYEKNN